jgi:F420-dependent oxidoreductase-like protein
MTPGVVAVHVPITTVRETVDVVRRAEGHGVAAAWLTSGGNGPDNLTTLAVAGASTGRILLGTSVAVTFSRHPLAMARESLAIDDVAPGRFRLGIGGGHRPTIEGQYGLGFERPLEHLREYVAVLRQAFSGEVDFDGARFSVHARLARPHAVPIYLAALRARAYELAGAVADGAISWVTPPAFLRDVAAPALHRSAEAAGRTPPRLVGHAYGLVTDRADAARDFGRERLAANTRLVFYREMFADAGFPEARDGVVPEGLLREVVLAGDEGEVADGLARFFAAGCDEIVLSTLPGPEADVDRTLRLLGHLANERGRQRSG